MNGPYKNSNNVLNAIRFDYTIRNTTEMYLSIQKNPNNLRDIYFNYIANMIEIYSNI